MKESVKIEILSLASTYYEILYFVCTQKFEELFYIPVVLSCRLFILSSISFGVEEIPSSVGGLHLT